MYFFSNIDEEAGSTLSNLPKIIYPIGRRGSIQGLLTLIPSLLPSPSAGPRIDWVAHDPKF